MLVVSRMQDEKIIIGDGEITITIVRVQDGRVRIGIDAPNDTPVHRQEVYEAIKREGGDLTRRLEN